MDEKIGNNTSTSAQHEKSTSLENFDNEIDNETKNKENVALKRTEVNRDKVDNIWLQAGRIVKDWESAHNRSLRGRNREIALKAAYLQQTQKRGIIRLDLQRWYNYNSNYARRKIYLLQKELGLLVPLGGRRRVSRFQQYCVSTELDKFNEEDRNTRDSMDGSSVGGDGQARRTLIQHLVATLSRRKPTFHKLHLYTALPSELYDDLNWALPSTRNKAKTKEFPIEHRRSVEFEIYPEGTTAIHMVSTANPYELHTPKGLVDFFSSLGEARSILKSECNDLRRIPPVTSWKLKMFDKDKTISLSELEKDIPQVMKFWSSEGIRVEHLGEVFQIYGKVMPETGPAFRFEVQSSAEDPEKDLTEAIIKETFPEVESSTAFEMIHDLKKRVEQLEGNEYKIENNLPKNPATESKKMNVATTAADSFSRQQQGSPASPDPKLQTTIAQLSKEQDLADKLDIPRDVVQVTSAASFYERKKSKPRISTGAKSLDELLGGGIETEAVTEFFGKAGSGKTQLCFTVAVNAQQDLSLHDERTSKVLYIDTERTFKAERVLAIAKSRGLDPDSISNNISLVKPKNALQLQQLVEKWLPGFLEQKHGDNIRLVIIDSIISHHRSEFRGRESLLERQQSLNLIMHALKTIADKFNIAVIVTNQLVNEPDYLFGDTTTKAAGGNIMAHASTHRIMFKLSGNNRIARMVDSPCYPVREVLFRIDHQGIADVPIREE
jgi:DNA repair protein RadA